MSKLQRTAALAVLAALVLVLAACESVTIGKLLADPSRYQGRTVHIQGTVDTSFGALGNGAYKLSDGTGNMWVISRSGIPGRGARVDVEGTVFQGAQLMGQSFGVALRETRRHVR